MLQGQIRVLVDDLSGRDEMPGDPVGDVARQAQQFRAYVLVEVGRRDVLGQVRRLERGLLVVAGTRILEPVVADPVALVSSLALTAG
ncbi:hypothetical protein EV385_0624 [Krasilnikovia cinnamomea]|uniref:Uncharacterized protein n=1 Tax=Krasilnikovia cinnamomea TaxID=349313 RepID=A0A4Q7ZF17_9ACTN|nr:hypothetical protein [Krasilnikovia cinnamomea]RZU48894.1 hypothetical protein EV385_0624 [Krasilnikovia cinnamomea]